MLGAEIEGPEPREFNGLQVDLWPRVSWSPFFALTFADLEVSPSLGLITAVILTLNAALPYSRFAYIDTWACFGAGKGECQGGAPKQGFCAGDQWRPACADRRPGAGWSTADRDSS